MMEQPMVLIAEDELIVGLDLCNTIEEAGFRTEGPHENISSVLLAMQKDKPDLAILDINLSDGQVFPLAKMLMDEDVPVIFHSGAYDRRSVEVRFPGVAALNKPCSPPEMIMAARKALKPA